jgi:glyoxylase-like metal-dependent hydrolase (beta-lactamase superfamily II)
VTGQRSVQPIADGLWSIRVAIPGALPFVFTYAFATPRGPVVVDPGWDTDESYRTLERGLVEIGFGVAELHGILVTHHHRDHSGLAARLRDESGAWIAMHANDAEILHRAADRAGSDLTRELEEAGAPSADSTAIVARIAERFPVIPPLAGIRRLEDGQDAQVPGWRVRAIWTPGHTPGHLCFVVDRAGVLLSGDHLLPRITPNVSHGPTGSSDPLRDYLASLDRLLADDIPRRVLPAHEWRFDTLEDRVLEIRSHHETRLREVQDVLAAARGSLWEVASALKWFRPWGELDPMARRSALGETRAHLAYLIGDGRASADLARGSAILYTANT